MEQRSDAWRSVRLGIPTASNAHKIVTPKKCELSKGAIDYALRLCAEKLLNATSESSLSNPWMERGAEMEAEAARAYEWERDVQTMPIGFVTDDAHTMGCSPDRLVLSDERVAVEIKSPAPHTHLEYQLIAAGAGPACGLSDAIDQYRPQVQMQCLVAELDRAHLWSWHPQMPSALIENRPDKEYIAKLSDALKRFNENLFAMFERAKALGFYQPVARATTPVETIEATDIAKMFQRESRERMAKEGFIA